MDSFNEFQEKMIIERDVVFKKMVEEFKINASKHLWNGDKLTIELEYNVFLYISEDMHNIEVDSGEPDPQKKFSYLIYLANINHIANYHNGGLVFIGFYNNEYQMVKSIPFIDMSIVGCEGGLSFDALRSPYYSLVLMHKNGNKHYTYSARLRKKESCQRTIDDVWLLETFYKDWIELRRLLEY